MNIRITGDNAEVADTVDTLRAALDVTNVTASYPLNGRSAGVRVDLDATTKTSRAGGAR